MSENKPALPRNDIAGQAMSLDYRKLFTNAPVGIFITTPGGEYVSVNPALARMYGYQTPQELMEAVTDIASQAYANPADREVYKKLLEHDGQVINYESPRLRRDGTLFWVSLNTWAVRNDQGEITHYQGFTTDITERKKAEDALRRSEKRLTKINQCLLSLGPDYNANVQRLTELCGQLLGATCALYSRLDNGLLCSVGQWRTPGDYNPQDQPQGHICYDLIRQDAFETVVIRNLQQTVYAKTDPNVSRFSLNTYIGHPVKADGQNVGAICAVFQTDFEPCEDDKKIMGIISSALGSEEERHQSRLALHEKNQESLLNYQRTQALLQLGQMSSDRDLKKLTDFVLEKAVELTRSKIGYLAFLNEDETRLRMHSWSRSALEECAVHQQTLDYAVEETGLWGEAVRQRKPIITNDYSLSSKLKKGLPPGHVRVIRHMNVPVFDSSRIVILAGVGNKQTDYDENDVHQLTLLMQGLWRQMERRRAKENQKKLQDRLHQAQKMESIGVLAGGIAHDFNNLLQVISGNVQLLALDMPQDHPDKKRLQAIERSVNRSAQLIQQILLFSRKAEIKRQPLDLNREIMDGADILERTIPKMISIELSLDQDLWSVHADPIQVEQVIMNLGSNAADAMPDGGTLSFETRNMVVAENTFSELEPGSYVLMAVSDTGLGMDKDSLNHVFEPFFTTKDTGRGTGLGLSSVYGIVKAHHGHISCYSIPDQGTTFKIYWPALPGKEPEKNGSPASKTLQQGTGTILVVDDEADIRELSKEILESRGYQVLSAENGEQAIELLSQSKETVDLVVLDLNMPGMGGYKCLQKLVQLKPGLPVIIASGYSPNGQTQKTLTSKAAGFVGKPYQTSELLEAINKALSAKKK
ncbi:GAF domain-containing protein [Desulfonatronovibrio hydrogenovorans]|uniref:GAF domain-containing protein n=1 Tax=Desulfonatronovibrio hydrogenovorans TaxID=53245 RepID=UPI00068CCC2C|nr:GAF domain-containing protein [Desulfonatronovibrio hydrogenovorans]